MKNPDSVSPISHISQKLQTELQEYAKGFDVRPWSIGDAAPDSVVRRLELLALYPREDQNEGLKGVGIVRGEFENKEGEMQSFDVYVVEEINDNAVSNVYFIEMTPGRDETSLAGDVTVAISNSANVQKRSAKVFWTHTMKSNLGTGVGTHGLIAAGEYILKKYSIPLEAGDVSGRLGITSVWEHLVQAGLAEKNPYRYSGLQSGKKKTQRKS